MTRALTPFLPPLSMSAAALFLAVASGLHAQVRPELEPNDTPTTAMALASGQEVHGQVSPVGDVDFYAIAVGAPSDLLAFTGPGLLNPMSDPDLTLFDVDGTTILDFCEDVSVDNYHCQILRGPLLPGIYYLRVRASAFYSPFETGDYQLDVVVAPAGAYIGAPTGPQVNVVEGAENNDPRGPGGVPTPSFADSRNAGSIAVGSGGFVFGNAISDYDFFTFTVTVAGTLVLETLPNAPSPANPDTCVWVTDANLVPLAGDDDGGVGTLSKLALPVTPGTYHAVVKGYGGSSVGNYDLSMQMLVTGPRATATVNRVAGGCGPLLDIPSVAYPVARVTSERPVLGSTFTVLGDNLPPSAPLLRVIGLVTLGQPFDLGPHGAPGCRVEVDPFAASPLLADPWGRDSWSFSLPWAPVFVGLPLEQQEVVIAPGANALGLTVSNRVASVLGTD